MDDVDAKIDSRKISIDHTVSTRDDSQQTMDDMTNANRSSFDVDFVEHQRIQPALIGALDNCYSGGRGNMTHSQSDPSFSAQFVAADHFPYTDCYMHVSNQPQRLAQSYTGPMGSTLRPPPPMGPAHYLNPPPNCYSHAPRSKVSVDPTLQARIEAVKIQEQLLGLSHPDVIFALAGIAKLYEKRGDQAQAANIMRESQMRTIMAKNARNQNQYSQEAEDVPTEICISR